jgi:serine/threonine-protein phosphatase PGAM5
MSYLYLARHGAAADDGSLSDVGRRQATLLAERMTGVPLTAIVHGPLPRAAETAGIVTAGKPGIACEVTDLAGDYVPFLPRPVPSALAGESVDQELAEAALARFARPAGDDVHELVVTHSFLVAWFVRAALGAPPERWIGLNAANAALTVIRYTRDRPPGVLLVNDMSHLPPELRWTGFPAELRSPV